MKILFLSTVHPSNAMPTKGTFNKVLLSSLRDQGHDVRALVPVPWREAGWQRLHQDATEYPVRFWYPPGIAPRQLDRFLDLSIAAAAKRLTRAWQPDIVVGYWTHPDGSSAVRLARRLGTPVALMTGGSDVHLLAADPARADKILATLHAADRVIAIGDGLRRRVVDLGLPSDRVFAFQRGVDLRRFHRGDRREARQRLNLPPDDPMLLWVGRMVPVKGLDVLIEAFPQVTRAGAQLYLVGGGPESAAIQASAGDRITLVGSVDHQQLGDWYRAADLMVLPSRSEGVPNVLLESLACGTPFVASAVGGIPDLAESSDWLVPADQPDALARAIDRMLDHPVQVAGQAEDDRGAAGRFAALLAETVANVSKH